MDVEFGAGEIYEARSGEGGDECGGDVGWNS